MNKECYTYKKILYNNSLFDINSINATYIIHLENNKRLNHIYEQLNTYHLSKINYIVFNKGYKNCKKSNYVNNTVYDLVDANLDIFHHAKINNYDNILILEDDFIYNPDIKLTFHIKNISKFLLKKNTEFAYFLGTLPIIMIPYDKYHYFLKSMGTHSIIFSKKIREKILQVNQEKMIDWDLFINIYNKKFTYYKPLCYQLFTNTENSQNWGITVKLFNNSFLQNITDKVVRAGVYLIKYLFKFLNLDITPEPGFTYFYFFGKFLFFFIIFNIINILSKISIKNKAC
jgi:hypothetical protein